MLAIWAHFDHVPPFQIRLPVGIAWFAGWVAEWASWCSGREAALSRGSVGDAVGIRYANCDKAVRVLGYKPRVGFAEGLRLACEDYKRVLEMRKGGSG